VNTIALREYKTTLTLSETQCEVLIGTLLGDGHLELRRREASLKIEQSAAQEAYVQWKYEVFSEWVRKPPKLKVVFDKRTQRVYRKWWFNTLSHQELTEYHRAFYDSRRKRVPLNIALTPRSLAVWFMDDGSRKSHECKGVYFNTQAFDADDLRILQKKLSDTFGIQTTLRGQRVGTQIYVPAEYVTILADVVTPYLVPCMQYKIC
jgi:hypothetical protein